MQHVVHTFTVLTDARRLIDVGAVGLEDGAHHGSLAVSFLGEDDSDAAGSQTATQSMIERGQARGEDVGIGGQYNFCTGLSGHRGGDERDGCHTSDSFQKISAMHRISSM
jgi:hypothetical protein